MLDAVNAARVAEGLTPLAANARLDAAACRQAKDLGGRALHDVESLSHQGSDGSTLADRLRDAGYAFRAAAENLVAGVADPEEAVRLWLASDGHRRNILTPDFREAGIADVGPRLSPGGNRAGPMAVWVLVLATPAGAASAAGEAKNPSVCRA
ncbi:MAG: CAP domain-containing protein [Alphaproteobacteria bacterium]